jgi:hypothetical protein
MACFLAIAEVSNAWVVLHSLSDSDEYATDRLKDLLKKNNGGDSPVLFINFEGYSFDDLKEKFYTLFGFLNRYKISDNLFNITESMIQELVSNFLDDALECGLIGIYPFKNFIRESTSSNCLNVIKKNRRSMDIETYEKYLPAIIKVREFFGNSEVVNNIKAVVNKIYIDPGHTLDHGLFDYEGRRISKLYRSSHEWFNLGDVGTSLMVAVGAFGFTNHNAILFLAFDRVRKNLTNLEKRYDWRHVDNIMPELLTRELDLIHYFSWIREKVQYKTWKLIEAAPLASIIPGEGLHLFRDSLDEDLQYRLDNFYPDIKYVLFD